MSEIEKTTSLVTAPDGSVAEKPTVILSQQEAELLRLYKKFLAAHGLREALYCETCWDGHREDGCRAFVTDGQILIECRCQIRFYQGQSY